LLKIKAKRAATFVAVRARLFSSDSQPITQVDMEALKAYNPKLHSYLK